MDPKVLSDADAPARHRADERYDGDGRLSGAAGPPPVEKAPIAKAVWRAVAANTVISCD
jgi:hypothetical protein